MKFTFLFSLFILAGCASFEKSYSEVQQFLQTKDTDNCINRASFYLEKTFSFSNDELAKFYSLRGLCFSQIGSYEEAIGSYNSSTSIAKSDEVKSSMHYQKAMSLFKTASFNGYKDTELVSTACKDMSEACRLAPDKFCSEYNSKKNPPVKCK